MFDVVPAAARPRRSLRRRASRWLAGLTALALAACGGGGGGGGGSGDAGASSGTGATITGPTLAAAPSVYASNVPAGLLSGTVLDRAVAVPDEGAGWGTTWYVRTDGGTAAQCTGRADAPYPGTGTGQPCAWKNPLIALPPTGTPARIAGGDRLLIKAGEYAIGYGAAGVTECNRVGPGCAMQPVPSGADAAHPTRIQGELTSAGRCAALPQLWGTRRPAQVISLQGSNHVRLACLEITDHAECIASGYPTAIPGYAYANARCNRDDPAADYAQLGLYALDSTDVQLHNLDIHGLADRGVLASRLTDWTLVNVRIAANPSAGFDGDGLDGNDSNAGTMTWRRVVIEWNGCSETYPGRQPFGCFGENNIGGVGGGYGDGVGTGATGGNWVIEDSFFMHNTSDGLDLLYHTLGGSVVVSRVWAEGNAGNQIKLRGNASVADSVIIGNCGFFARQMTGTVATSTLGVQPQSILSTGDHCRALGDTVALDTVRAGDALVLVNNTIVGEGNVIVVAGGPTGTLQALNNILVGFPSFSNPTAGNAADIYIDPSDAVSLAESYQIKQGLRSARCSGTSLRCGSAGLTASGSIDAVDPALLPTSIALDTGLASTGTVIPTIDLYGRSRPAGVGMDLGAIER